MELQINIRVFGKVQGVGFRQSTKNKADSLKVQGIVVNDPDGSVYIMARGTEPQLREFVKFCEIGPELAEVKNVIVEEDEIQDFKDFSIIL